MMSNIHGCWLLVVAGCASGNSGNLDASGDAFDCGRIWYADIDEDGHGDPMASERSCTQPAKTAATADDCDDNEPYRNPSEPEICDGLDNDCMPTTVEACPAGCQPAKRPPPGASTYLFCTVLSSWPNAQSTCASVNNFGFVQIDDAAENAWLRSEATTRFGGATYVHIGGTDSAAEAMWLWQRSNEPFWQGGASGVAVGGRYVVWGGGEPNDDNGAEDCADMRGDGLWDDRPCGNAERFICER